MTMKLFAVFLVSSAVLVGIASARSWEDIALFHSLEPVDRSLERSTIVLETDPLRFTSSPSMTPSRMPSALPSTSEPSQLPSFLPTITPRPTTEPSRSPSVSPSTAVPSTMPSSSPTRVEIPANPIPSNPRSTYFNYDPTSQYGPGNPQVVYHNETMNKVYYFGNGWTEVAQPSGYWNEFGDNTTTDGGGFGTWQGILTRHNPMKNRCANVGKQSPIDVRASASECLEHHQIRSRPGDMAISNNTATTKLIESNKLRLVYSRRPCSDSLRPECAEPDPPASDFPHNWGGYADVIHVDFKVPSEHTVNGERFDGEMQIFHVHPLRRRTPAVAVMIRATMDTYNSQLQAILDQFQAVYDLHKAQCAEKVRRERKLVSWVHRLLGLDVTTTTTSAHDDYETWADISTPFDDPNFVNRTQRRRLQQQDRFWHPHHEELVPSIWFYGYEGSLTEPPCGEWVSWFVTDVPMLAHYRQVEQLRNLIFTHESPDCVKTSVHSSHDGVARPIQDSFRRPVWHCTSVDFPPDDDRDT